MVLNFAVLGHFTAVTLPFGSAALVSCNSTTAHDGHTLSTHKPALEQSSCKYQTRSIASHGEQVGVSRNDEARLTAIAYIQFAARRLYLSYPRFGSTPYSSR
jgi:hypothetical protein